MNSKSWGRLIAAPLVCLWVAVPVAQEMPAQLPPPVSEAPATPLEPETAAPGTTTLAAPTSGPEPASPQESAPTEELVPPQEPTPAEAAALPLETALPEGAAPQQEPAPAVESQVAAEPPATSRPGAKRIVVLPVEFTVYEKSVAGIEAVPDWSESAQYSLGDAAGKMLRLDNRFEIVAMPTVDPETDGSLREHVELFKIVANTVTSVVQSGGKAWAEKKTNFDYTLGDGLVFLADAAQADYAFILGGAQIKQTGGSVFVQLLAAAGGYAIAGGGTYVVAGIVDLRNGNVTWFNSMQGGELFGMTSNDVRDADGAQAVVTKMFEGYPGSKLVTFRPF